jgi:hypothetical membrane protein
MIIFHIVIALLSLVFAVIAIVRPSVRNVTRVGASTVATLITGAVLVFQGASLLHVCLSGLLFTSLTIAAMTISLRSLQRQQAVDKAC